MKRETLQQMLTKCPFHRFLGLTLEDYSTEDGSISISISARQEYSRSDGKIELHGGVIASLIDIAGDYAVALKIGAGVPTINLHVDYLRPARGIPAIASANIIRCGRSIAVVDIEVKDDTDTLIAIGRGTYSSVVSG